MNNLNSITIPMFEVSATGSLKPNLVFHRPFDKLHSRCIEYPFAASKLGDARCILDVGTIKSDPIWISWLENLPIEVHATDYDAPLRPFEKLIYHQADIRKLPVANEKFDKIFAVSVIEHIGLKSPQIISKNIPEVDENGDIEAVKELARVLKPGGELIMTFPFGKHEGLILDGQARNYTINSIKRFESFLKPSILCYYEYQHTLKNILYNEYENQLYSPSKFSVLCIKSILKKTFVNITGKYSSKKNNYEIESDYFKTNPHTDGIVVWRDMPIIYANATHVGHVDGILCGVWKKE